VPTVDCTARYFPFLFRKSSGDQGEGTGEKSDGIESIAALGDTENEKRRKKKEKEKKNRPGR